MLRDQQTRTHTRATTYGRSSRQTCTAHCLQWDRYIAFEEEQQLKMYTAALYSRIVGYPLRDGEKYMNA